MDTIPPLPSGEGLPTAVPQHALLDFFFPGFSVFSSAVQKYLHIDLNLYIPLVLLFGGLTLAWSYFSECFSDLLESHLMSVVDIRTDDEIYNMLMAWVANQRFSKNARRFVVNTDLTSRSWYLWRWDDEDDNDDDDDDDDNHGDHDGVSAGGRKKKALAYTPTFGSHWFLYKSRVLIFRRMQNNQQHSAFVTASMREEISIACFGRNPWVLKELLHEAREQFRMRDEAKTLIYRGTTSNGSSEPQWQRCMARTSRPFSTVILNEKVKKELIDDVTDYLNPTTRRWYANRGIPYRRGYLLHGPPGTGKSSLSLALAGFFKMRIYIASLNSVTANEENLASLFAELPRRCVVLLEDIDTAGLTHTREEGNRGNNDQDDDDNNNNGSNKKRPDPRPAPAANPNNTSGRLSLSGLLNILDGVASHEGRVLIMTTNHIEKLDKALIRPGRVDMMVKFDRADGEMTAAIFRAIYAPLEGDEAPAPAASTPSSSSCALFQLENVLRRSFATAGARTAQRTTPEEEAEEEEKKKKRAAEAARKKEETIAYVNALADQFAAKIPGHEFSPAEIQGFLLKNKRDPERAVKGAEQWVVDTRKEKKEKELKEAQERREREEKEKKEKEEAEQKKKKKKARKQKVSKREAKKSKKGSKKDESESDESASASSSEADSESEPERETAKKAKATTTTAAPEEKVAKAKDAALGARRTPQKADSGYGTP